MISFLQHLYARIYTRFQVREYKVNNRLLWFLSIASLICLGRLIYWGGVIRGFLGILPKKLTGEGDIVVSLTSFPARIEKVWLTVDTIMRQNLKPAAIFLHLTKDEFPYGWDSLPQKLKKYENLGLRIVFVDENLRPHNKYFYSFQEKSGKCVVTVDDDLLYNDDVLQRLWNNHLDHPKCVCANAGRRIKYGIEGFSTYNCWTEVKEIGDFVGKELLACGYGGVLYPPEFYINNQKHICDSSAIKETSLRADDLWLKAQELLAGVNVCIRSYYPHPVSIPSSSKYALSNTNRSAINNGNDEQWNNLIKKYNISKFFE